MTVQGRNPAFSCHHTIFIWLITWGYLWFLQSGNPSRPSPHLLSDQCKYLLRWLGVALCCHCKSALPLPPDRWDWPLTRRCRREGRRTGFVCWVCVSGVCVLVTGDLRTIFSRATTRQVTLPAQSSRQGLSYHNPVTHPHSKKTSNDPLWHTQDHHHLVASDNRRDGEDVGSSVEEYGGSVMEGMLALSGDSRGLPQFVVIYFHRSHLMFDWLSA